MSYKDLERTKLSQRDLKGMSYKDLEGMCYKDLERTRMSQKNLEGMSQKDLETAEKKQIIEAHPVEAEKERLAVGLAGVEVLGDDADVVARLLGAGEPVDGLALGRLVAHLGGRGDGVGPGAAAEEDVEDEAGGAVLVEGLALVASGEIRKVQFNILEKSAAFNLTFWKNPGNSI